MSVRIAANPAAIRQTYGLAFQPLRTMDTSLIYQPVAPGNVDRISALSTDGRIGAFNLEVLEDDRRAIPPYDAVILAGRGSSATVRTPPFAGSP